MECVTVGNVTVAAAGQGSIVTAAPALMGVCQRMVCSVAAEGNVSVASVSASYLEHQETSVRSVQPVGTSAARQGESN